jgi:hypothetical protein
MELAVIESKNFDYSKRSEEQFTISIFMKKIYFVVCGCGIGVCECEILILILILSKKEEEKSTANATITRTS